MLVWLTSAGKQRFVGPKCINIHSCFIYHPTIGSYSYLGGKFPYGPPLSNCAPDYQYAYSFRWLTHRDHAISNISQVCFSLIWLTLALSVSNISNITSSICIYIYIYVCVCVCWSNLARGINFLLESTLDRNNWHTLSPMIKFPDTMMQCPFAAISYLKQCCQSYFFVGLHTR